MNTTTNDAGLLREELAHELALWKAARFIPGRAADRFYKRVRRLARMAHLTRDEVLADLNADADLIEEEDL